MQLAGAMWASLAQQASSRPGLSCPGMTAPEASMIRPASGWCGSRQNSASTHAEDGVADTSRHHFVEGSAAADRTMPHCRLRVAWLERPVSGWHSAAETEVSLGAACKWSADSSHINECSSTKVQDPCKNIT